MKPTSQEHTTTIQIGKEISWWVDYTTWEFKKWIPEITWRSQVKVSEIILGRRKNPHLELSKLSNLDRSENVSLKYPNGDEIQLTEEMKDRIWKYLQIISKADTLWTTFENWAFKGFFDCWNFANYLVWNHYHNRFLDLNKFHIFSWTESAEIWDMILMTSWTFESNKVKWTDEINIFSSNFHWAHYAVYIWRGLFIQKLGDWKGFEVMSSENMQKLYKSLPLIFTLKKRKILE